jgi:hypothetical protein
MALAMPIERRHSQRVPVRAEARLRRDGMVAEMEVHNLSLGGAFLTVPLSEHIELKTGARFELTLTVHEECPCHAEEDGSTVHAQVRIVRRDPGEDGRPAGIGIAFERTDLETWARLQCLVARVGDG